MAGELIKVTGLEDVQKMLAEAPRTVVATAFLKALQAGANVIEAAVEARVPVSDEETAGQLKAAILTDVELDSNFRGGRAEIGFGKQGHIANFVEYGHRMIGHKPEKKELGKVEPHPFMRPAAEASADAAIEAFGETLAETLKEGLPNG